MFYTDRREAFAEVLPPGRHIAGKRHTVTVEQDNSNTRHHLGRFTRRTKVVSKAKVMVDLSIRLWRAPQTPEIFASFQKMALSTYR